VAVQMRRDVLRCRLRGGAPMPGISRARRGLLPNLPVQRRDVVFPVLIEAGELHLAPDSEEELLQTRHLKGALDCVVMFFLSQHPKGEFYEPLGVFAISLHFNLPFVKSLCVLGHSNLSQAPNIWCFNWHYVYLFD